jgi:hypothetical protein
MPQFQMKKTRYRGNRQIQEKYLKYKSQGGGPGSYTEEREKEIFPARIIVSSMRSPAGTGNRAVAV